MLKIKLFEVVRLPLTRFSLNTLKKSLEYIQKKFEILKDIDFINLMRSCTENIQLYRMACMYPNGDDNKQLVLFKSVSLLPDEFLDLVKVIGGREGCQYFFELIEVLKEKEAEVFAESFLRNCEGNLEKVRENSVGLVGALPKFLRHKEVESKICELVL